MRRLSEKCGKTKRLQIECLEYSTPRDKNRVLFLGFEIHGATFPVVFAVINESPNPFAKAKLPQCELIQTISMRTREGYATELWKYLLTFFPDGFYCEAATLNGAFFLKSVGAMPADFDISKLECGICDSCESRMSRE